MVDAPPARTRPSRPIHSVATIARKEAHRDGSASIFGVKILCLTSEFPPHVGGIATHVHELTRHLALLGNDVTVLLPDGGNNGVEAPPGVTFRHRRFRVSTKPFFDFLLAGWLQRYLAAEKPDVVHVHGMKALQATKACGNVPVVFTNHTSDFLKRLNGTAARKARTLRQLNHIAAMLAPSRELVSAAREIGYTGPAHHVPNGVDTDKFSFDADTRVRLRQSWGVSDKEAVILLACRLSEEKGVQDFARACEALRGTRCLIAIAGDGSERAAMVDIFCKIGISEQVRFVGAVPNDEMPGIYSAADMAVLPSHMEGMSVAGLEAMACGLSLIGTRVGGTPDLIDDGRTGVLVPPHASDILGAAIHALAETPVRRHTFGKAARQKAVSDFAWPGIAGRTLDVLKNSREF